VKITGISVFTSEVLEIQTSGGRIEEVRKIQGRGGDYPLISPGFFDIQVNGYMGIDYSAGGLSGSSLEKMAGLLGKSGTSRHLPTIITSPEERIIKNLKAMAAYLDEHPGTERAVPGFHIEGPYISEADGPRGAHDASFIRDPDFDEFLRWQEASGGRIRIVTLAPERRGALDFIRRITERGVVAAIGHTSAEPGEIRAAVKAGARLSTHLGNGSHAFLPRLNNYLWEQLASDSLFAGIIADGFHLPPAVLKTFARAKGPERIILTSDVSPLGGLNPGSYSWGGAGVVVHDDGHVGLEGTSFLAGAGHLLDRGIANFVNAAGYSVADAVRLCTENPMKLLSLSGDRGFLRRGSESGVAVFRYEEGSGALDVEGLY